MQNVFYRLWKDKQSVSLRVSVKAYLFQDTIKQSLAYLNKIKPVNHKEEFITNESVHIVDSDQLTLTTNGIGNQG